MLGKTAGGLYWMFRNLERAENTARLIEAGFRIALTRSADPALEWQSVILTTASTVAYSARHETYDAENVIDFLLRDRTNPNSVLSVINFARDNAKMVRTALTSEVWVAVNETWMTLVQLMAEPVTVRDLPKILSAIRHQSELVRGALYGTMMRNDIYDFCRLGTFIERFDNTTRIIDVKYYTLLPDTNDVGGHLDNVQWETLLRSVSAYRAFRWAEEGDVSGPTITRFLVFDRRLPRSLAFCASQITANLDFLNEDFDQPLRSKELAHALRARLDSNDINSIYATGLHEFFEIILSDIAALSGQIERDFRFNPAPAEVIQNPSGATQMHTANTQS